MRNVNNVMNKHRERERGEREREGQREEGIVQVIIILLGYSQWISSSRWKSKKRRHY